MLARPPYFLSWELQCSLSCQIIIGERETEGITPKMQWSRVLSAIALSAATVSAKRSLAHVSPAAERLAAKTVHREPQIRNEHLPTMAHRASTSDYQFLTNKTQKFLVDGTAIPDVDFDVGESYAGSLPIYQNSTDDELFFWFFPSTNAEAEEEILIWLNGGVRFDSLLPSPLPALLLTCNEL